MLHTLAHTSVIQGRLLKTELQYSNYLNNGTIPSVGTN